MKKLVLTTVCALAVTGAAFAQGTLNWVAVSPAAFTAVTNGTQYSPLFGGAAAGLTSGATATTAGGFYYELLYNTSFTGSQVASPTTLAGLATWADAGLAATNTVSSTGKASGFPGNTAATVPWNNGTTNNIMLVGWSSNLGTSWTVVSGELQDWSAYQIANAYFGESAAGYINPAVGNPGYGAFGTAATASGLPIKSLNTPLYLLPVPEPATFALIGLGGLSLLLFRRRQ